MFLRLAGGGVASIGLALGLTTALGCGEVFTSTPGTGGGGTTTTSTSSTSSTTSTSGTSTSTSTGIGGGGVGGGGQAGSGVGGGPGGAGGALPTLTCDAGFTFSASPIIAGQDFTVSYSHAEGYTWVYMLVEQQQGVGTPSTVWEGCECEGNPNTWHWTVKDHGAGVLHFTFGSHEGLETNPPIDRAHCSVYVTE